MAKRRKKLRNLEEYAMGTNNQGMQQHSLPDPQEMIAESRLMAQKAVAKGSEDPLVKGLEITAELLPMVAGAAGAMGGGGAGITNTGDPGHTSKNYAGVTSKTGTNPDYDFSQFGLPDFAMGGVMGANAEVEGGEVIETPAGQVKEIDGPSHDKGGVPIKAPAGTKVFSDQLMVGGQTMADRKKAREAKLKSLGVKAKGNPTDKIIKNSYQKTQKDNEIQEQQDMELQNIAGQMDDMMTHAMGTGPEGIEEYALGGVIDYLGKNAGNLIGMAGNIQSSRATMENVNAMRASEDIHTNQFKDYGKEGLATINNLEGMLEGQKANALTNLERDRVSATKKARGSSRGVNTMRALDTNNFVAFNKSKTDLYDSFSKQMMAIIQAKAGMQDKQDQVVMGGAAQAEADNRADSDAYYTARGQALQDKGKGTQQIGKDINAMSLAEMQANIMKGYSGYDYHIDREGNIVNNEGTPKKG
jgi:hypothetical protein